MRGSFGTERSTATVPFADRLVVEDPEGRSRRVPLDSDRLTIGRSSGSDVPLRGPLVSRHHAELRRDPFGRWWVHDLGSRNRTLVNGLPITERVLGRDDVIEVGHFAMRLEFPEPDPGAATEPGAAGVTLSEQNSAGITTLTDAAEPRIAAAQLTKLSEFGRTLLRTEERGDRLRALCRLMICPEFRGRAAVAFRLSGGEAAEHPAALCPPECHPEWAGWQPHVSKTLLHAAWQRREPLLASNVGVRQADVKLSVPGDVEPMSAVACPLRLGQESVDVLYVVLPPQYGTNEWLALAALASEHLEQAERTWAVRAEEKAFAAIESDLARARDIQDRLIPRDVAVEGLDVAIGFEPCRWVGGDYVDVVSMHDGRVLLTIADVCGKGLSAALIGASIHTMVHACARSGHGVTEIMQALDEHLHEFLPDESFVTMVLVALDPATGAFEYANAGHPAALVLGPGDRVRRLSTGTNKPLGIVREPFVAESGAVETGQALFLFTDGVTDLGTSADARLDQDELESILAGLCRSRAGATAKDFAARFESRLAQAGGAGAAMDDRTFLLVRRVAGR